MKFCPTPSQPEDSACIKSSTCMPCLRFFIANHFPFKFQFHKEPRIFLPLVTFPLSWTHHLARLLQVSETESWEKLIPKKHRKEIISSLLCWSTIGLMVNIRLLLESVPERPGLWSKGRYSWDFFMFFPRMTAKECCNWAPDYFPLSMLVTSRDLRIKCLRIALLFFFWASRLVFR